MRLGIGFRIGLFGRGGSGGVNGVERREEREGDGKRKREEE